MSDETRTDRPSWRDLGTRARAWRLLHAAWSVVQLVALGHIWASAVTQRRHPTVWAGVALLGLEGAALAAGRGSCPMSARQQAWGDPIPFFELLLPPRAAKAAIPILAVLSVAAILMLVAREPGLVLRAAPPDPSPTRPRR